MCRRVAGLCVVVMLMLAACSRQDDAAGSKGPAAKQEHVWTEQVQTLEKARQLESDVMEAHERREEQLEKQEN